MDIGIGNSLKKRGHHKLVIQQSCSMFLFVLNMNIISTKGLNHT